MLLLPSVAKIAAGAYSVSVSNISGAVLISSNATLVVLTDTDHDGMPDDWERQYGLDPNNPADASLDPDGDGIINRDEYTLGRDPKVAGPPLRFDSVTALADEVTLQFSAAANRTFTILYRDSLTDPWRRLVDIPGAAAPGIRSVKDRVRSDGERYYRLVSPLEL